MKEKNNEVNLTFELGNTEEAIAYLRSDKVLEFKPSDFVKSSIKDRENILPEDIDNLKFGLLEQLLMQIWREDDSAELIQKLSLAFYKFPENIKSYYFYKVLTKADEMLMKHQSNELFIQSLDPAQSSSLDSPLHEQITQLYGQDMLAVMLDRDDLLGKVDNQNCLTARAATELKTSGKISRSTSNNLLEACNSLVKIDSIYSSSSKLSSLAQEDQEEEDIPIAHLQITQDNNFGEDQASTSPNDSGRITASAQIQWGNPLLNHHTLVTEAWKIGKSDALGKLIEMNIHPGLSETIIESANKYGAGQVANILFGSNKLNIDSSAVSSESLQTVSSQTSLPTNNEQQNHEFKNSNTKFAMSDGLVLSSLTAKEAIEALPTFKYFVKEILHIELSLPSIIDNNYFKIAAHSLACNIGMFGVAGKFNVVKASAPTMIYGAKILDLHLLITLHKKNAQPLRIYLRIIYQ